ncbi:MAG: zinc-ribbon domain-containing protein [Ruminococcaceae bacterium]|nr:zinc-ribbon domain-containing protein [Oscillospiraceae bacterium]
MAYCTSCGNQLTEDSAFCEKCGKAVVGNAPQNEGYRYARPSQRTEVSKRPSITALVFSVVSLFTSLFCYIPFVFLCFQ